LERKGKCFIDKRRTGAREVSLLGRESTRRMIANAKRTSIQSGMMDFTSVGDCDSFDLA
jgi:hypothetical protein